MRVVVFVKATADSEAEVMPGTDLLDAMTRYNEQLVDAGIMLGGDGLKPSKYAKRIRFSGPERTVVDGPFAETKELVAGYWIWEVRDMDEAVAWVKRCPNPMLTDSDIDIRPVFEMSDFAEISTPEIDAIQERNRARLES
ncbi:dehydrogenase [Devosia soli]|uniref:Dehydrogenase n=1 Tax=Devosia soli TaxID=361041 RepID=A0A0F5LCH1_9HYPH|nr:YciI family protein [Devosia soli]KKB79899.1 dehydrogenase [Devosia soli]